MWYVHMTHCRPTVHTINAAMYTIVHLTHFRPTVLTINCMFPFKGLHSHSHPWVSVVLLCVVTMDLAYFTLIGFTAIPCSHSCVTAIPLCEITIPSMDYTVPIHGFGLPNIPILGFLVSHCVIWQSRKRIRLLPFTGLVYLVEFHNIPILVTKPMNGFEALFPLWEAVNDVKMAKTMMFPNMGFWYFFL